MTDLERITDIVVEHLGCKRDIIEPTSSLIDDLGADSLDLVEIELAIEDSFDIGFGTPSPITQEITVEGLVEAIAEARRA